MEPVLAVKPHSETLPPLEKIAIVSEPTTEKCLCEKARGWLEESIHNPINYHPNEVYDYGSRALRDVGDDERYYEDVKSRCECRKRKHGRMASSIEVGCELGKEHSAEDVDAAKTLCLMKAKNVTSNSTTSSSASVPLSEECASAKKRCIEKVTCSSCSKPVELAVNPHEEFKATKAEVDDSFHV